MVLSIVRLLSSTTQILYSLKVIEDAERNVKVLDEVMMK